MNSSVLIFHDPVPDLTALGFDFVSDWKDMKAEDFIQRKVVAFHADTNGAILPDETLQELAKSSPQIIGVLVGKKIPGDTLSRVAKFIPVFAVHESFSDLAFEESLKAALVMQDSKEQSSELVKLKQLHKENLENMSKELREALDKREKNLERAKKRITTINKQVSGLHKALVAVHQANSVGEVEVLLSTELKSEINLSFVRVLFENQSQLETQLDRTPSFSMYKSPLTLGGVRLGKIIFGRTGSAFSKLEQAFLSQVSEGVSLAIDRLTKLEQAEHLKREWESTFDAVSDPLCLTTKTFQIIRTNKAFAEVSSVSFRDLIGMNCFKAFLGKQMTEPNLRIEKFRKETGETHIYEVKAQQVLKKDSDEPVLLIMFRDITEQQRIEKQIFESAKMAELGTVGSSIAHELNNPLGGLLSFLQLVKMDLPSTDPEYEDIDEMQKAGNRCKEIIENLLGFTRRQESTAEAEVDLREIVTQALKLIELKTRSSNIEVNVSLPTQSIPRKVHGNLMAQALNHILQNSLDAIEEKLTHSGRFKGRIEVELLQEKGKTLLRIRDNGIGIDRETQKKVMNPLFTTKGKRYSGLGLTLAYKIIADHCGQLEISSQPMQGAEVKISLSNV